MTNATFASTVCAVMPRLAEKSTFDAAYYDRYYGSAKTRVHDAEEIGQLCTGVTGLLDWWKFPLRSALEIGAGAGLWRDWFAKHRPEVRYRSTEGSAHACKRYGHEHRDIATWRASSKFDLIVCQGVLQYLSDKDAGRAIDNIAAMSRGFFYLEVITRRDIREVCDKARSDVDVHPRSGSFYAERLRKHFTRVGAGLWCRKDAPVLFYELEQA